MKRKVRFGPGFNRGLLILYSVVMIGASLGLWLSVRDHRGTVEIYDWATVMERRTSDVPAVVEIQDRRWGVAEVTDNRVLFQLDALIKRVPRYFGSLDQDQDRYRMRGNIEYIGGRVVSFALGQVLWMEDEPYFGLGARDDLAGLLRLMREQVYTEENLARLLLQAREVMLHGQEETLYLSTQEREAFWQTILTATRLEGAEEIDYALQTREAPYCRLELEMSMTPGDSILLLIYPNEYVEVWDMTSARGTVLSFYGDLVQGCRDLLETPPAERQPGEG